MNGSGLHSGTADAARPRPFAPRDGHPDGRRRRALNIGIFAQPAAHPQPTGIGLHVRELLKALGGIDRTNHYRLYHLEGGSCDPFSELGLPANFRARRVRFPKSWLGEHPTLWWNWCFPLAVRLDRLDVFHGPNHFLPAFSGCKRIVTIHDLAFFRMPIYGPTMDRMNRYWTAQALKRADAVIALSQSTQRDLGEFGLPSRRSHVIHGAGKIEPECDIRFDRMDELRRALSLPEKYILFMGSIQPRKNVPFLVRAFARMKRETALPHKLVLAGHRDTGADEILALARELGIGSDVIVTGYVEPWQVPLLYKSADLFVLPTRYEGFGQILLESMAYGTPVIATDTSSIRECAGDAAACVPVDDDAALAEKMTELLTDRVLRELMIERGRKRAAMFTWETNARQTLALYESVVKS